MSIFGHAHFTVNICIYIYIYSVQVKNAFKNWKSSRSNLRQNAITTPDVVHALGNLICGATPEFIHSTVSGKTVRLVK